MNRLCGACGETHASLAEAKKCMDAHSGQHISAYRKQLTDFILAEDIAVVEQAELPAEQELDFEGTLFRPMLPEPDEDEEAA